MTDTSAADFLLEYLMQLINCDNNLIVKVYEAKRIKKKQIEWVYEEMKFLQKFLKDSEEIRNKHTYDEKVKKVVAQIRDVIYEVEVIIDSCLLIAAKDLVENNGSEGDIFPSFDIFSHTERADIKLALAGKIYEGLEGVIEEIEFIKTEVMQIYEKKMMYGFGKSSSARATSPIVEREILVDLEDETTAILDLLTQELEKQLKLIPIVGMPGLGKTTLATTLYNHSFIIYHFYVRAWIHVSQVYCKTDLLLSIFNSANIPRLNDEKLGEQLNTPRSTDEKLGEQLYKHLKGKRYLIVMDDIWDISAWNDLKIYLPDDNNGSRIIFTTRLRDVAVSLHPKPHYLRFLNDVESWDLLQHKAFLDESCPPYLTEIGKRIAKKCGGLPLAIVVVSGLLSKNDKTQNWWRHVAESVSSYIVSDPEQYMGTLALSYNYLPNHLKACFLYFGAFPEDYEISVWQLMWLWVAEGFIRQNESKSLEDVAEDNLMDLVGRSLVVISKKRFDGRIKACRIHDLLRDLCLKKAQEDNFLYQFSGSSLVANKQRRLSTNSHLVDYIGIMHHAIYVRSFLSLAHNLSRNDVSFICRNLKLLRILNLSSVSVSVPFFPGEIQFLIHLRYLELYHPIGGFFNSSISNLLNLETCIVGGFGGHVYLPDNIWKMVKLRHLYTKHFFELPRAINLHYQSALYNLQTIGKLDLRYRSKLVLPLMPNLRKLKCVCDDFPKLDFLIYLETLHLSYNGHRRNGKLPQTSWFPPNLKNLTLSFFHLPWEEMWTLGRLPNLEVLKLSYEAFEGSTWDTNDSEFRTLRFLKLRGLEIEHWNASSNNFPNLQQLVLDHCQQLKEIPNGLGDISTLEMIQLQYCSSSAETSARQIQEQQQSMGNDGLKIFIHGLRHN